MLTIKNIILIIFFILPITNYGMSNDQKFKNLIHNTRTAYTQLGKVCTKACDHLLAAHHTEVMQPENCRECSHHLTALIKIAQSNGLSEIYSMALSTKNIDILFRKTYSFSKSIYLPCKTIYTALEKKWQNAYDHSLSIHRCDLILVRTCQECNNNFQELIKIGLEYQAMGITEILPTILSTNNTVQLSQNIQKFESTICSLCRYVPHNPIYPYQCHHVICRQCFTNLVNNGDNLSCELCLNNDNIQFCRPCFDESLKNQMKWTGCPICDASTKDDADLITLPVFKNKPLEEICPGILNGTMT